MDKLIFSELGRRHDTHHIAETTLAAGQVTRHHTHDFPELFLIRAGEGWHHWNGAQAPLREGHLAYVAATDWHSLSASPSQPLVFINLAFAPAWWASLMDLLRIGDALSPAPRKPGSPPRHVQLSGEQAYEASRHLHDLLMDGENDVVLLTETAAALLRRWLSPLLQGQAVADNPPPWLGRWLADLDRPELLPQPLGFWQKRANVSPAHLARTCRQWLNASPTELINRARIALAQHRLRQTEDKVAKIALDVGFENLGYFHRVFLKTTGCTPHQWRLRLRSPAATVPLPPPQTA